MRRFGRRSAVLLATLALTVPPSIGATASTAEATTNPLCGLLLSCPRAAAPTIPGSTMPDPLPQAPADPAGPGADSPIGHEAPDAPGPATRPDRPAEPGSPTSPADPTAPLTPTAPATPAPPDAPAPTDTPTAQAPVEAADDDRAPIFSRTPASMGSEKLSFTGLSTITIVTVPTTDGTSMRALRISADSITISGFSLTVRSPGEAEPGLVTKADTMTLAGHVNVYLGSITATTKDGKSLTIGTDTPPPLDDVEPGLLRVTMGLVGSFADSITYENTDQEIVHP